MDFYDHLINLNNWKIKVWVWGGGRLWSEFLSMV